MKDKMAVAELRAKKLLKKHNLEDWSVGFNQTTSSVAEVRHNAKELYVSKRFLKVASKDEFDGVLLHEISHALLGPGMGHGEEFVNLCKSISPNDKYAQYCIDAPVHVYKATCPRCKYYGFTNARKDLHCAYCYKEGHKVKFLKEKNVLELKEW